VIIFWKFQIVSMMIESSIHGPFRGNTRQNTKEKWDELNIIIWPPYLLYFTMGNGLKRCNQCISSLSLPAKIETFFSQKTPLQCRWSQKTSWDIYSDIDTKYWYWYRYGQYLIQIRIIHDTDTDNIWHEYGYGLSIEDMGQILYQMPTPPHLKITKWWDKRVWKFKFKFLNS